MSFQNEGSPISKVSPMSKVSPKSKVSSKSKASSKSMVSPMSRPSSKMGKTPSKKSELEFGYMSNSSYGDEIMPIDERYNIGDKPASFSLSFTMESRRKKHGTPVHPKEQPLAVVQRKAS